MLRVLCVFLMFCFHSLLSQSINITKFGVNGQDQNDDTVDFDKAIEYIAEKGGILYIPKGNYYLNNDLRKRKGVNYNNNIFLISKSFSINLHKNAILHYQNNFKGFRFRSVVDPNEKTIRNYSVLIEGGVINAINNFTVKKGNPEIWGFVAETLRNFTVKNLEVKNFQGTAAIASYSNDTFEIVHSTFLNVTGNPEDLTDNHGDAVYVANTTTYKIINNKAINSITLKNRIGRVGICIEYEGCGRGSIENNLISGYDRGIHVELINGSSFIRYNTLVGNSSGIVLWNNNGNKQIIDSNIISYKGLQNHNKSLLYTSAPIIMLGYNMNNNSLIINNQITVEKKFYKPVNILQITSSNIDIKNNKFIDETHELSLAIAQGQGNKEKIENINFVNNIVQTKKVSAYDVSNLNISANQFDITEMTISFDNSKNIYSNNKFIENFTKKTINIFGKYHLK
ncbi:glycosyl hydrolase family 28-related protein [Chryseobacterium camelliae]|uniref:glycosyl hydrolase family 28-related protein n=1 Tax=Chryseobacterium camelliae TaxID=1265445 RepID=UPI00286577D9|nr:hypothetical protein [Chryseobacterium camelliae]MDR6516361.1 hypothetical protein [Chryseobacterium camelliae]